MTPNQIIEHIFNQLFYIHQARNKIDSGQRELENHLGWFHKFFYMLVEELEKKYPEVSMDEIKKILDERIKNNPFTWDKK